MLSAYIPAGNKRDSVDPKVLEKLKILEALKPLKSKPADKLNRRKRLLLFAFVFSLATYAFLANFVFPLFSAQLKSIHFEFHTFASVSTVQTFQPPIPNLYRASNFSTPETLQLLRDTEDSTYDLQYLAEAADKATRYAKNGLNGAFLINSTEPDGRPSATTIAMRAAALPLPEGIPKTRQRPLNELYKDLCPPPTSKTPSHKKLVYMPPQKTPLITSKSWTKRYGQDMPRYNWCRGAHSSVVPDLRPAALYKSAKARPEPGLTVVTQLSLERLGMLETQCKLWPNQIAAVLYIPMQRGKIFSAEQPEKWHMKRLYVGLNAVKELHEAAEADPHGCVLDLEIVVEERCAREAATLYPANAVRNRALMLAATDIVLLLDADFVLSNSLARKVAEPEEYSKMLKVLREGSVMVLPAFEAWDTGELGRSLATESVVEGKDAIVKAYEKNLVLGFHMAHYSQGHGKTNHTRWSHSDEMYQIDYQIGFEPYVLMARETVPWYDERFRGYYWNKVCHLMHIAFQHRFTFFVYPDAFVVHVPHKTPPTKWRTRASGQKQKNYELFSEAITNMKRGQYVPVTSFAHLCVPPKVASAASAAAADGKLDSLYSVENPGEYSKAEEEEEGIALDPQKVAKELEKAVAMKTNREKMI